MPRPAVTAAAVATVALLAGCGPKDGGPKAAADGAAPPVDVLPDTPVLPAPQAPIYTVGRTEAADALVQKLVEHGALRWSESLSGAAGALALSSEPTTLTDARWAAVRAGYPYAVHAVIRGDESPGAWPTGLAQRLSEVAGAGVELGIARARGPGIDRWVVLVSRPALMLNSFPRELALGETLRVTGSAGQWRLAGPDHVLREGQLPLELPVDLAGEWWLEVRSGARAGAVQVPIFVGVETPVAPLFDEGPVVAGPDELLRRAWELVDVAREEYGVAPFHRDAGLQALAAQPLERLVAGEWTLAAGVERLRKAGFVGGPAHQLACTAPKPALCVAQWLESAEDRVVLLDRRYKLAGLAGQARGDGVSLLLNLSAD